MSSIDAPTAPALKLTGAPKRHAILLTSYMTGATAGNNLGVLGYSYDLVARQFIPLLEQWGEVIEVRASQLEQAVRAARARNLEPIHVSFLPFHDVTLTASAPNVVVPAWEFPDVPDAGFDGKSSNDWVAMANQCALVLVGGPWTAENFRRAGIRTPVRVVQVPTPEAYFQVPAWRPDARTVIDCRPFIFAPTATAPLEQRPQGADAPSAADRPARPSWKRQMAKFAMRTYKCAAQPLLPPLFHRALAAVTRGSQDLAALYPRSPQLELSGIVYTSILNIADGRKNWDDLLTGFLEAFRERSDVTLVIKLICSNPNWINWILGRYQNLDVAHRCKLVFLTDYLTDEQMFALTRATTYYVTTTKAEGNCLPVMNFLAAGRPCLSTCHTAISDYFSENVGFVLQSHPEPSAWPHDLKLRWRTTWHRIVWTSVVEQLRSSHKLVKDDRAGYEALAGRGRDKMLDWAHASRIGPRLWAALDLLTEGQSVAAAA